MIMAALIAALFWIVSLSVDVQIYDFRDAAYDSRTKGLILLIFGWLFGPLGLTVAWYANLPLLVCIGLMLFGRVPSFLTASVSLVLALTALFPMYFWDPRWGGGLSFVRGPAIWLWLASFVTVWLAVALLAWPNSRTEGR
jgi:hypothetical protein